jgi:hypothetical protein
MQRCIVRLVSASALVLGACTNPDSFSTAPPPISFHANPCGTGGTVQVAVNQAARIDCSNGGNTVTLAGNGANYLVVAQFPTDQLADQFVLYSLATGNLLGTVSASQAPRARFSLGTGASIAVGLPSNRPNRVQMMADHRYLARGVARAKSGTLHALANRTVSGVRNADVTPPPPVGTLQTFHVSSFDASGLATSVTVGATLAYVGNNVLLYIDTLAPANGFTSTQLQAFGVTFDQTLYPIDTTAFGVPTDVDNNGHVIMLMSPTVNSQTSVSQCQTQGFVAGFFDPADFDGLSDANSNHGEVFYSIVPDPTGRFSCAHSVADVGGNVPATFLHELQHLINFSQHVVVGGGAPQSEWMDEGMSIVAEELGSVYYERKCPPPTCRTVASAVFPDSSLAFVSSFLYDSYQYALLPDTASLTLHSDSDNGFSWLLMRWLGDQVGAGVYKQFEQGPANGIAAVEQVTGQAFPALFANFGLALYTDSLPGLPRTTAPAVNRFVSRNVKQLWATTYAFFGPAFDVPTPTPLGLFPITTDTSSSILDPGAMTFFRLNTAAGAATVSIEFSAPGTTPLQGILRPQLAVFRLPTGQ